MPREVFPVNPVQRDRAVGALLAVTRLVVQGEGDVDVRLLLGDLEPAEVLATGLRELAGEAGVRSAVDLERGGPGLTISQDTSEGDAA